MPVGQKYSMNLRAKGFLCSLKDSTFFTELCLSNNTRYHMEIMKLENTLASLSIFPTRLLFWGTTRSQFTLWWTSFLSRLLWNLSTTRKEQIPRKKANRMSLILEDQAERSENNILSSFPSAKRAFSQQKRERWPSTQCKGIQRPT